jgi:hypothetical protein
MPDSPFPGVKPTLQREDLGIYSWICAPGAMINRFAPGSFASAAGGRFITQDVDQAMERAFPRPRRYCYIHDFSGVVGYESEMRTILTEWGRERTMEGVVASVWLIAPRDRPVVRMGIAAGLAVLRAFGQNIDMSDDLVALTRQLGLRPLP